MYKIDMTEGAQAEHYIVVRVTHKCTIGLVVKYLVAIEMPRVRFPDGASFYLLAPFMHFHSTPPFHTPSSL